MSKSLPDILIDGDLPLLPAHPEGDRFGRNREALRLPSFLKKKLGKGDQVRHVRRLMRHLPRMVLRFRHHVLHRFADLANAACESPT